MWGFSVRDNGIVALANAEEFDDDEESLATCVAFARFMDEDGVDSFAHGILRLRVTANVVRAELDKRMSAFDE